MSHTKEPIQMFKLAIFALVLTLTSASTDADWRAYKKRHNKEYCGREDVSRREIWQSNLQKIQKHNEHYNKNHSSHFMGENQFTDMTNEEFRRVMNGLKINRPLNPRTFITGIYNCVLPESVDWRTKGYVTPVKNQGNCGSCWAFSTTGSLEGQHFKSTGQLVSLSESNLIDCSQSYGTSGCSGGYMDDAFSYIIGNHGIDTEKSYPYTPEDNECAFSIANVGATMIAYTDVESGNENDLQKAVAEVGPVSVAIDASNESFQMYKGGIYDEPLCSSTVLDHAVLVVGYGRKSGKDYWIVKNSWGTSWGEEGYILMSRNKNNQCGIASLVSYPVV